MGHGDFGTHERHDIVAKGQHVAECQSREKQAPPKTCHQVVTGKGVEKVLQGYGIVVVDKNVQLKQRDRLDQGPAMIPQ